MLAIHNNYEVFIDFFQVANAFAKLSKCQQFTTLSSSLIISAWLQTLLQSYQNVSNSQLLNVEKVIGSSCKRFCKVIKMLAIHNIIFVIIVCVSVANAFAKLSKCQQFTTIVSLSLLYQMLQTLMQSYQNVSNSQLKYYDSQHQCGCKRLCKVIKMLAIHNQETSKLLTLTVANAYAKLSKCQQFTTVIRAYCPNNVLQTLMQSYQNVSNSQLYIFSRSQNPSCKRFCKVIKMLAIHNNLV